MKISILGSTGSIGQQTLDVARWHKHEVIGLAAGKNLDLLAKQIAEFKPKIISINENLFKQAKNLFPNTEIVTDNCLIATTEADVVIGAIPGLAGLAPTRAALAAGRHVALANKEAMVVAGPLIWEIAKTRGAKIIPVDSEHSAIYQCLVGEKLEDAHELILTASGGPFRTKPDELTSVTPAMALKHPNWQMGQKVTIDSSTLMNKGLEVIEAHFLFGIPIEKIRVLIHPQSVVHSAVRFVDGQIKAQLGPADMRLPIAYAIESSSNSQRLPTPMQNWPLLGQLEFFEPDFKRFPCLSLAIEAGKKGGVFPTALNAADEIAVTAFLENKISFLEIAILIEKILENTPNLALSWENISQIDSLARQNALDFVKNRH